MKKIKTLTIILIIVLITMVAFFGVYVQKQNRMENKVKDYELSTDFNGNRTVRLQVSQETEEIIKDAEGNEVETDEDLTDEELTQLGYTKEEQSYNSEESLNVENYKKSKEIIESRLKGLGLTYYEVSLDEQNGDIIIKLPEDSQTDYIVSNIYGVGKFEIKDTQTDEVLMDNNDIKLSNVMYGSADSNGTQTAIYLNIEFDKEGTKKLEEITSTYVPVEETEEQEETTEETENTETETDTETETEEATEKTITMSIDDEAVMTTSFENPIRIGALQLTVGSSSSDEETIRENIQKASTTANILDNEAMPIKYELEENEYILSDISEEKIQYIYIAIAAITVICLIIFTLKFKMAGLLGAISTIGFAAIYILTIKYTDAVLSLTGIFGIFVILLLNIILLKKMLLKIKNPNTEVREAVKESYKEFFMRLIPICISVIVFCFTAWTPISSLGMMMFWGIVLIAVYNFIVTTTLFKIRADK